MWICNHVRLPSLPLRSILIVAPELFRGTLIHIAFICSIHSISASLLIHCRCEPSWPRGPQCPTRSKPLAGSLLCQRGGIFPCTEPWVNIGDCAIRWHEERVCYIWYHEAWPTRWRWWLVCDSCSLPPVGLPMWQDQFRMRVRRDFSLQIRVMVGIHVLTVFETGLDLPVIRKQYFQWSNQSSIGCENSTVHLTSRSLATVNLAMPSINGASGKMLSGHCLSWSIMYWQRLI